MKKLFTLSMVVFSISVMLGQTPQKMSYQAVIRNASNALVTNANISMKMSILQTSVSGAVVYSETHSVTTNTNGLATLEIGGGTIQSGSFSAINWANGPYFVKTETDPAGGTNYTITGTSQLLSVPYALLAEKAVRPTYQVFRYVTNYGEFIQTIRNEWVDCPDTTINVPETGHYLVNFFGGIENHNEYYPFDPASDYLAEVRVLNVTEGQTLNYTIASRILYTYRPPTSNEVVNYYIGLRPSTSDVFSLAAGDQLKIQYKQSASSSTLTTPWTIVPSGMSILKIGD